MHNQVNRNGGGGVAKLPLSQLIYNSFHAWERVGLIDEVGVRKLNYRMEQTDHETA